MSLDLLRPATPVTLAPARRFSALPISILVHVLLLVAVVVIPLLANDVLPLVAGGSEIWESDVTPVVPQPVPPRTPQARTAPIVEANTSAAPLDAPQGVHAEKGLEATPPEEMTRFDANVVDGAAIGAGVSNGVVDTPPPTPAPVVMAPVRVINQPRKIVDVTPVYPEMARAAKISGMVIIEAVVGVDGAVRDARVLRSSPLLDEAALAAVRQWRYTPTLLNGNPVPVIITVTVNFTLR